MCVQRLGRSLVGSEIVRGEAALFTRPLERVEEEEREVRWNGENPKASRVEQAT